MRGWSHQLAGGGYYHGRGVADVLFLVYDGSAKTAVLFQTLNGRHKDDFNTTPQKKQQKKNPQTSKDKILFPLLSVFFLYPD